MWRVAALVLAAIGGLILFAMLKPQERVLGSNSVYPRDGVGLIHNGESLCARRLVIPSGTGRIRWWMDSQKRLQPPLTMTAEVWQGPSRKGIPTIIRGHAAAKNTTGLTTRDITLDRPIPAGPGGFRRVSLCYTAHGAPTVPLGRTLLDDSSLPLLAGGVTELKARVALTYLPRRAEKASRLEQLRAAIERASLFRAHFVAPWMFWVVLFVALPLLGYAALRLLAAPQAGRRLPIAVCVGLVAFGNAACWAFVTPTYQSPDESEHVAAVQYFAETGKAVDAAPNPKRPVPWSSQEAYAIDATRELTTFERNGARNPWLKQYELAYEGRAKLYGGPRDDGGGYHPVTSSHTPLYYAAASGAYLVARHHSPFAQLLAIRMFNALLGGLTVMFVVLAARELFGRRRDAFAVAAGLFVAFLPQFGFISGAVNNDNGVNTMCALVVYLCVRGLMRGLTWRLGIAIGLALGVAPLMKGTGYELVPPVAVAVALMLLKARRSRTAWLAAGLAAAGLIGVSLGWDHLAAHFGRSLYATPGGASPTASVSATHEPMAYLSWLWQDTIPWRPPFLHDFTLVHWPLYDIYVREGFASFGWYAIFFPQWVYLTIAAAIAGLVVLGMRGVYARGLPWLRGHWQVLLFLFLVPITVYCAVEAAYLPPLNIPPLDGTPEQGRYGFTAISAVALLAAGGCLGAGRRRSLGVAAALSSALIGMTLAGQLLQLCSFYT